MMKPPRLGKAAFLLGAAILLLSGCREEAGDKNTREQPPEAPAGKGPGEQAESVPGMEEGRALYESNCLVCHQANGGGVPGLNPPLKDTEYVVGSKSRLLRILIQGSNEGLVIKGRTYSNAMPGFAMLSDQQLALLATYIRNSFGNRAGAVEASEVSAVRSADTGQQE